MIVVKVELHSANTGNVTELGKMIIANDGRRSSNDPTRGDYTVKLGRRGNTKDEEVWNKPLRVGEVKDYPRLTYSIWILVARALKAVGIEKWSEFVEQDNYRHPDL